MGVKQTVIRELTNLIDIPKSARLDRLRSTINQARRKLVDLQHELSNLKSSEMLVIQKMNRFQKFVDLEQYYPADRVVRNEPKSLGPNEELDNDPDPRINWTRNRLLEGLKPLETERDRIQSDILLISQEILKQRTALVNAQEELVDTSDVCMKKDAVAKQLFNQVYMLYETHRRYLEITTDENGRRKFNADTPYIKEQENLTNKFRSLGNKNPYVLSGDMELDYNDPGSEQNEASLMNMLNRSYNVLGNQSDIKLNDELLTKYSNQMFSNSNDAFISKDVARQDDQQKPESDKALKNDTGTASKLVGFVNNALSATEDSISKLYMTWDQTSSINALKSWFNKQISGLNQDMPFCVEATITEDPEKKQSEQTQDENETLAATSYAKQFAETKKEITMETINNTYNLLLQDVRAAVDNDSGKGTASSGTSTPSVTIMINTYSGRYLYQTRIVQAASIVVGYVVEMRTKGYIDANQYTNYLDKLIQTMEVVKTGLTIKTVDPTVPVQTKIPPIKKKVSTPKQKSTQTSEAKATENEALPANVVKISPLESILGTTFGGST